MTSKNKTQFFIKHFERTKTEDTKAELAWDIFAKANRLESVKPKPVEVEDDGKTWILKPDRALMNQHHKIFGKEVIMIGTYIFIDGPHHWTDRFRKKDDWEDRLLVAQTGRRTFRIDSPLLEDKRYWPDVLKALNTFIKSKQTSHRMYQ